MGAIGSSGFIFRDFIKYILPTLTGTCLLLPLFVEWKFIKIDQIVFLSFLSGYIIYPIVSQIANLVHDHLPCVGGISLSAKSPAVEESRWVKSNWHMRALRPRIDKDEREYLYLTESYLEYFQITGFYFLLFSIFNFVYIFTSSPRSLHAAFNSCMLFEYIQSVTIGTIVGYSVPSVYAGFLGLVISFLLFQASVIEYRALFGVNGAYEFFLEKYQASKGSLARSVWGRVSLEARSNSLKLKLELYRNNKYLDTCTADDIGRFQFYDKFNECINYRCKIVVATPGFAGESEMSITRNSIPCFIVVAKKTQ